MGAVQTARSGIHAAGSCTPISGTAATPTIAANEKRKGIILQSEVTGFYWGYGTITTSTGFFLAGGTVTQVIDNYTGPLWAVTGSGTVTFRYAQLFV